jgi:hypothetical protein
MAADALLEDPILFAAGGEDNSFHIIYCQLPDENLKITRERPVINQLLKDHVYSLFVFSNSSQSRWHFINVKYDDKNAEKRRVFRRISISPDEQLRTASERISMLDLEELQGDMFGLQPLEIQKQHDKAFDVEEVTKQFFEEYKSIFKKLETTLKEQVNLPAWAHDYSLQFLNRCMFIYFIQRKGWLGGDKAFFANFWDSYRHFGQEYDTFVSNWLDVLFFEAFNNKFHGGHSQFPPKIKETLSLAPYLNGGLFKENNLDREHKAEISDELFEAILNFLERYNFTISEDSPLDIEVAVDPEMIGKVYESLVNVTEEKDEKGDAGIFYTPRTEIDMMCRLALVDHLSNHIGEEQKQLLNQLIFALEPDDKKEADKAVANAGLWGTLNEHFNDVAVLDPACGSGSFLVGMLNILDDLQERANYQLGITESPYERKKKIIGQSLYGVDVMDWACHVAELRLWLALVVDADFTNEELHVRREPLLPHFSFKIRCGDSLVQEIGGINFAHASSSHSVPAGIKTRVTKLKNDKLKFYNNDATCQFKTVEALENEEKRLFVDILNARAHKVREDIKSLKARLEGPRPYQIDLYGGGSPESRQMSLEAIRQKQAIEKLNAELVAIEASQKALLSLKELPFVWDIAFVEIFEGEKGGFDVVVGNPPYVRQEKIADPKLAGSQITRENKREYKAKLARSVYQAFPRFFGYKPINSTSSRKLSAKSDLYIYFYFHGLSLLNKKGSFCFITSNSWLDVGYGADLQEFLLKHCHVKLVIDNQVKRSFESADVNSVITLFSSPDENTDRALEEISRFVMFTVPFEGVLDAVIFDEIEAAAERKTTREYRVFPVRQSKLLEDGCEIPEEVEINKQTTSFIKNARYIGNKWGGKYLRAPDIYWTILEKHFNSLIPFSSIVTKDYGIKSGCVEFFYISNEIQDSFGIEEEFLYPAITSSQHIADIYFKPNTKIFICHKPKSQLKGTGALQYIQWGEKKGFDIIPSVRSHNPFWYSLSGEFVDFLLLIFWDKRFWTPISIEADTYCSNNFFYGKCLGSRDCILTQLNSIWYFLQLEMFGRVNQGQGVLTTYGPDYDFIKLVSPSKFEHLALEELHSIAKRPVAPIFDEIMMEDRRELDSAIFDALNLTQGERDAVYEAVINLVEARLAKAKSV